MGNESMYCKCKEPNIGEHCGDEGTCCYVCHVCGKPVGDEHLHTLTATT